MAWDLFHLCNCPAEWSAEKECVRRQIEGTQCLMLRIIELQSAIEGKYHFTVHAAYGSDQSDVCAHLSFHSRTHVAPSHLIQSIYQCL